MLFWVLLQAVHAPLKEGHSLIRGQVSLYKHASIHIICTQILSGRWEVCHISPESHQQIGDHEAVGFVWYRAGEGCLEKAAATLNPERLPVAQLFIVVSVLQVIALFVPPLNECIYRLVYTKATLHGDTWLSRFPAKKMLFGENPNHESKKALNFLSATLWAKETMTIKSDLLNKQNIIGNYQRTTWNLKSQNLMKKLTHIQGYYTVLGLLVNYWTFL